MDRSSIQRHYETYDRVPLDGNRAIDLIVQGGDVTLHRVIDGERTFTPVELTTDQMELIIDAFRRRHQEIKAVDEAMAMPKPVHVRPIRNIRDVKLHDVLAVADSATPTPDNAA